MNTPSTPRIDRFAVARSARARRAAVGLAACFAALCCTACGQTSGQLFALFGVGQTKKVKAQYKLSPGPILVLVDDPQERLDWPVAERMLFDAVTQELLRQKATERTIPWETLQGMRQADPEFANLSARQVGEKAGADQMLWLEVQYFQAREELQELSDVAGFAITLKVLDPKQKESRSDVRLWPTGLDGYLVTSRLSANDVDKFRTRDLIVQALSQELAEKIARLFHDHEIDTAEEGRPD